MMKRLMLSCKKATEMMEKKITFGLSPAEKFQLFVHTMMCDACKTYQKQSVLLDKFLTKHSEQMEPKSNLPTLPEEVKAKIINELEKQ